MKNIISLVTITGILVCVLTSVRFDVLADELDTQAMGCMTDSECEVRVIDCDDGDCPANPEESFIEANYDKPS